MKKKNNWVQDDQKEIIETNKSSFPLFTLLMNAASA